MILEKFLKIHIKHQIENGAQIIQIFDSWAGLLNEKDLQNYIYKPTLNLVQYVKSLNIPVICFPRNIKNYKDYTNIIKPDVISIDYNVTAKEIEKNVKIPVQGNLDPSLLFLPWENLESEWLKLWRRVEQSTIGPSKWICGLGHGVLPKTPEENVRKSVNLIHQKMTY